jgi:hypothetical protein
MIKTYPKNNIQQWREVSSGIPFEFSDRTLEELCRIVNLEPVTSWPILNNTLSTLWVTVADILYGDSNVLVLAALNVEAYEPPADGPRAVDPHDVPLDVVLYPLEVEPKPDTKRFRERLLEGPDQVEPADGLVFVKWLWR